MPPSPTAFSPGSVTCFFVPRRAASPEETASLGCAICLDQGVAAAVEASRRTEILVNGRAVAIAPAERVAMRLAPEPVRVHLETPLALGCGFGVSGAAALATAFAIANRYDLPMDRAALGLEAHVAEVVCGTGLGDVAAQLRGGVVHRTCLTGPFDGVRLNVPDRPLFHRVFGPLSTKDVLASEETVAAIRREGAEAIAWLGSSAVDLSLEAILDRSLEFSTRAGLLRDESVRDSIAICRSLGGHAAMILLGRSVLATTRPEGGSEDWTGCGIDHLGTRLL